MPESERPQYTWMPFLLSCIYVIFRLMFIVQAIIGFVYINDCPAAPSVPFFMIMCGFISGFWALSRYKNGCKIFCYCLMVILFLIWISMGSIYVYGIFEPDYNKNTKKPDHYCNKTLHLSAFWCITLTFILTGIHIFLFLSASINGRLEPFEIYNDEDQPILFG